jgi:hypothetical protein
MALDGEKEKSHSRLAYTLRTEAKKRRKTTILEAKTNADDALGAGEKPSYAFWSSLALIKTALPPAEAAMRHRRMGL